MKSIFKTFWFIFVFYLVGAVWVISMGLMLGMKINFIDTQNKLFLWAVLSPSVIFAGGAHMMWIMMSDWLHK